MGEAIPPALDGERIDRVVAMFADVSRSAAAQAVADGSVRLNGEVISTRSHRVTAEQIIEIDESVSAPPPAIVADPDVDVDIMYADDDVIVVNKHNGQIVHPGAGNRSGTLIQGLLADHPGIADVGDPARPGVVHRLDKGTTGVLAVARTPVAYDSLTGQLRERSVHRRYLTLVWGAFESHEGVIDAPLGRAIRDPTRMVVRNDGKPARTLYRVHASWESPEVTLLSCELETGRTHQIRVHLEAIGHPVVGDARYASERAGVDIDRPALHAAELGFEHPTTGEWMAFEAPVPADMARVLVELGPPGWGDVADVR